MKSQDWIGSVPHLLAEIEGLQCLLEDMGVIYDVIPEYSGNMRAYKARLRSCRDRLIRLVDHGELSKESVIH